MSKQSGFKTLDDFWPFYISQHMQKGTRRLHFVGTSLGLACAALAISLLKWQIFILGLALSYGSAWFGHFFIEKNAPATFQYPLLSFRADFRMYRFMWRRGMDAEIARQRDRIAPYLPLE